MTRCSLTGALVFPLNPFLNIMFAAINEANPAEAYAEPRV